MCLALLAIGSLSLNCRADDKSGLNDAVNAVAAAQREVGAMKALVAPGYMGLREQFEKAGIANLSDLALKKANCWGIYYDNYVGRRGEYNFPAVSTVRGVANDYGYKKMVALDPTESQILPPLTDATPMLAGGIGVNADFLAGNNGVVAVTMKVGPLYCPKCATTADVDDEFQIGFNAFGGGYGGSAVFRKLNPDVLIAEDANHKSLLRAVEGQQPDLTNLPASSLGDDYRAIGYMVCRLGPLSGQR